MTDEMQDETPDETMSADDARLQAMLEREARAYNAPPATAPRDEMWNAVRARLDAGRRVAGVTPIAAAPSRRRAWTRHAAWGAVAAAALVAGVGLGRLTGRDGAVSSPAPRASSVAVAATPAPVSPAPGQPAAPAGAATVATATGAGSRDAASQGDDRGSQPRGSSAADRAAPPAYRDAAAVHLAAAEALLVALHSPSETASGDTAVSAWASDLLGTTRVLLDSPAARDRRTRELLQDLELVLAQIARLRPDAPADGRGVSDRALIDQAIRERQMLTRLRASGA